jgi:hypothetical protein
MCCGNCRAHGHDIFNHSKRDQTRLGESDEASTDLHFHDLRHEAVSRFFELSLSMLKWPRFQAIATRACFSVILLDSAALAERLQGLCGHVPDGG